jgi:hypothetical protein
VELPLIEVSNVVIDQDSIEFDVDQVGVPVLIRVSYFPNWSVTGADAVYRVAPNAMVVVPSSEHVSLSFGRTGLDWVTVLLSLAGIGLCIRWRREGDASFDDEGSSEPNESSSALVFDSLSEIGPEAVESGAS